MEVERIVNVATEREVPKVVEVEKRIPVEVIREREVRFIEEKIVELIRTIYDIEFRDKEVCVPVRYEVPKELIQQKAV